MKCIVRRLLKDDFPGEFLPYLREDGTVASPVESTETTFDGEDAMKS